MELEPGANLAMGASSIIVICFCDLLGKFFGVTVAATT